MPKKKTWVEKFHINKEPIVKPLEKTWGKNSEGSLMLIATPQIIENYVKKIELGKTLDISHLREILAKDYKADFTCPLTTGIFLRIMAEANYEKLQNGTPLNEIAPFWRIISPKSPLAKKLTFGKEFLIEMLNHDNNQIK